MQTYTYQTKVDYGNTDNVLVSIRKAVKDLKEHHPQLRTCSLADVGFTRKDTYVDVTLYFKA